MGERIVAVVDELAATRSGERTACREMHDITIAVGVQERKKRKGVMAMGEGKIAEVNF